MINPAKLTAEQGFVDGCVVEYQIERGGHGVDYLCFDGPFALDFKHMIHIRPLTGPMAIWNFLPKETVAICRGDHGYPEFQLYATHPAIVGNYGMWSGYKIEPRPWWAQKKA